MLTITCIYKKRRHCLHVCAVIVSSTVWRPACHCGKERGPWLTWTGASSTPWHCPRAASDRPWVSTEAKCEGIERRRHSGVMGANRGASNAPREALRGSVTVLYRWGMKPVKKYNFSSIFGADYMSSRPAECDHGRLWRGQVQRWAAEELEILAFPSAHGQTESPGHR